MTTRTLIVALALLALAGCESTMEILHRVGAAGAKTYDDMQRNQRSQQLRERADGEAIMAHCEQLPGNSQYRCDEPVPSLRCDQQPSWSEYLCH